MHIFFVLILALLVIILVSLAEVYRAIPLPELKRRVKSGDRLSKSIYRAASYGPSVEFLLWLLAVAAATGFFVLIAKTTALWLAITTTAALVWIGFVWLPRVGMSKLSRYLASLFAGPIAKLMQYIHPITKRAARHIAKAGYDSHTGIYEPEDILRLLDRQEQQSDNRIQTIELNILRSVLTFNSKVVGDIMTSERKVKSINLKDLLGPVVLNELHRSGHSYFPVYDQKVANIVGTLDIRTLGDSKESVPVASVMIEQVCYVHEEQYLSEVLQTMIKTNQQLFVVINSDEKYVGIMTVKDVLSSLVGDQLVDEFGAYEDRAAVAKHFHFIDTPAEKSKESELPEEPTEVIE